MNDDRENPYLDPAAREVFENLCATKVTSFDELASVSPDQIKSLFAKIEKYAPSPADQTKPGPNRLHKPLDRNERKIVRAIADFKTLTTWIAERCFDLEACRALCVAAIESLEAETE